MELQGGLHLHPPFPPSCMRSGLLMSVSDLQLLPNLLLHQQPRVTALLLITWQVRLAPHLNPTPMSQGGHEPCFVNH